MPLYTESNLPDTKVQDNNAAVSPALGALSANQDDHPGACTPRFNENGNGPVTQPHVFKPRLPQDISTMNLDESGFLAQALTHERVAARPQVTPSPTNTPQKKILLDSPTCKDWRRFPGAKDLHFNLDLFRLGLMVYMPSNKKSLEGLSTKNIVWGPRTLSIYKRQTHEATLRGEVPALETVPLENTFQGVFSRMVGAPASGRRLIIKNPERREEMFIPTILYRGQGGPFRGAFTDMRSSDPSLKPNTFHFNGFPRSVTAMCMFGSHLMGVTNNDVNRPLIKHDNKFSKDEIITEVYVLSDVNPYENWALKEFDSYCRFINLYHKTDIHESAASSSQPKLICHLPWVDYLFIGLELYLKNRITDVAFGQFVRHVLNKKVELSSQLRNRGLTYKVTIEIISPLENLVEAPLAELDNLATDEKLDTRTDEDLATAVLTMFGLLGEASSDPRIQAQVEKKFVSRCLAQLRENQIQPEHSAVWKRIVKTHEEKDQLTLAQLKSAWTTAEEALKKQEQHLEKFIEERRKIESKLSQESKASLKEVLRPWIEVEEKNFLQGEQSALLQTSELEGAKKALDAFYKQNKQKHQLLISDLDRKKLEFEEFNLLVKKRSSSSLEMYNDEIKDLNEFHAEISSYCLSFLHDLDTINARQKQIHTLKESAGIDSTLPFATLEGSEFRQLNEALKEESDQLIERSKSIRKEMAPWQKLAAFLQAKIASLVAESKIAEHYRTLRPLNETNIETIEHLFAIANPMVLAYASRGWEDNQVCSLLPLSEKQIQVAYQSLVTDLRRTSPEFPHVFFVTVMDGLNAYNMEANKSGLLFYSQGNKNTLNDAVTRTLSIARMNTARYALFPPEEAAESVLDMDGSELKPCIPRS